jgi:DASH complex subunit DAM1
MPGPTPHRTPLRRVSQGSLFALSRSGAHSDAPHGLGFLEPALAELADEADTLRANVDGLRALSASLDTFNEAFASWMYVMNMNALTVEWPEVRGLIAILQKTLCVCVHFSLVDDAIGANGHVVRPCEAEGRCVSLSVDRLGYSSQSSYTGPDEDARAAEVQAHTLTTVKLDETTNATALGDTTTLADGSLAPESSKSAVQKVKKKGKPKLTPKEKKERSVRVFFLNPPPLGRICSFLSRCVLYVDGY